MLLRDMTRQLEDLGVPTDSYSVGRDRDESYCLVQDEDGSWRVYYSERGARTDDALFYGERSAFKELRARLLRDHVVRSRMTGEQG